MALERRRLGRVLGATLSCALLVTSLAHSTALASILPGLSEPAPPFAPSATPAATPNPQSARQPKVARNSQFAIPRPQPLTLTLRWVPSPVAQGQTLTIFARANAGVVVSGRLLDRPIIFAGSGRNYWTLAGVPPWGDVGEHQLTVVATDDLGRQAMRTILIPVVATEFAVEEVSLLPDREKLLDPVTITEEWKALQRVFQDVTPRQFWSGPFWMPVRSVVTSEFGARRSFGGGPPQGYHTGIDLRGAEGTPVVAAGRGRVVLAEQLTLRGRAVILDHGLGVHTAYYHMAAITVEPGQLVHKGQVIGRVGMTGLVSGPHLHWELRIQEVAVDPLAWTMTTIPAPERSRPQLLPSDAGSQ